MSHEKSRGPDRITSSRHLEVDEGNVYDKEEDELRDKNHRTNDEEPCVVRKPRKMTDSNGEHDNR